MRDTLPQRFGYSEFEYQEEKPELLMSFTISSRIHANVPCLEVSGKAANHLDTIARYVITKTPDQEGFLLDIRAVTAMPRADEVFIHILKYPPGNMRKIALLDRSENRGLCSVYERLVRTRGYQVRFFGQLERASEWLSRDDAPSTPNAAGFWSHTLAVLGHSLNPMRFLHATNASR